jgi:UDPglucose--hexose-1-phosphate uridylyltransferase
MYESPHRRLNLLTGEWVLISPQRLARFDRAEVNTPPTDALPAYDASCYLCPGNVRAGGHRNPDYSATFVFDNDFPSLLPHEDAAGATIDPLLTSTPERGICRVLCFSPRHDLTLPELDESAIENVIATWIEQTLELSSYDFVKYVQIFENKGTMMGCSNPHPHSQIWGTPSIMNEPAKELKHQGTYFQEHGRTLLEDYLREEHGHKERILFLNDCFTALIPYWAVWPFESIIIPHRNVARLNELSAVERRALADILKRITTCYDNLFEISFPYAMGFHQAPFDGDAHPEWVLHAHFYPPLLSSASVRKSLVGYDMLAMPERDLTPEGAAERLRSLSDIHYKQRK